MRPMSSPGLTTRPSDSPRTSTPRTCVGRSGWPRPWSTAWSGSTTQPDTPTKSRSAGSKRAGSGAKVGGRASKSTWRSNPSPSECDHPHRVRGRAHFPPLTYFPLRPARGEPHVEGHLFLQELLEGGQHRIPVSFRVLPRLLGQIVVLGQHDAGRIPLG